MRSTIWKSDERLSVYSGNTSSSPLGARCKYKEESMLGVQDTKLESSDEGVADRQTRTTTSGTRQGRTWGTTRGENEPHEGGTSRVKHRTEYREVPVTRRAVGVWRTLTMLLCLSLLLPLASATGAVLDEQGGSNVWRIYRPVDGTIFPVGTRMVAIIGVKPFGSAARITVEDPQGNTSEYLSPAIRTFFSITLDHSGETLPPGVWEVTLVDTLWPNTAQDQVSFVIQEGENLDPLPSLETPAHGESFPANIPFIVFAGITGGGSKAWLRLVDLSTEAEVMRAEVNATEDNVWAYAYSWTMGIGLWQAQIYSADPDLGGYPTDWHEFTTVDHTIEDWPLRFYWEW